MRISRLRSGIRSSTPLTRSLSSSRSTARSAGSPSGAPDRNRSQEPAAVPRHLGPVQDEVPGGREEPRFGIGRWLPATAPPEPHHRLLHDVLCRVRISAPVRAVTQQLRLQIIEDATECLWLHPSRSPFSSRRIRDERGRGNVTPRLALLLPASGPGRAPDIWGNPTVGRVVMRSPPPRQGVRETCPARRSAWPLRGRRGRRGYDVASFAPRSGYPERSGTSLGSAPSMAGPLEVRVTRTPSGAEAPAATDRRWAGVVGPAVAPPPRPPAIPVPTGRPSRRRCPRPGLEADR